MTEIRYEIPIWQKVMITKEEAAAKELMLSNRGAEEDSQESPVQQGDHTSQF